MYITEGISCKFDLPKSQNYVSIMILPYRLNDQYQVVNTCVDFAYVQQTDYAIYEQTFNRVLLDLF